MTQYGLVGQRSGELLSYGERFLVHDDRAELEFLFPGSRVVIMPRHISADQTMPLPRHPELTHLRWPLDRRDFA